MLKKIIIGLVLLGLVVPGWGKAAIQERPSIETCELRHNLTSVFGPGFEAGKMITSAPSAITGVSQTDLDSAVESLQAYVQTQTPPDPTKVVLYDEATMKTKVDADNTLKVICSTVWAITLGGTDCTDDGLTAAEAITILQKMDWIIEKLPIDQIPFVGDTLENLLSGIVSISLGIEQATYYEEAALACLVDKIETAEDWFFIAFLVVAGILFLYGAFVFLTAAGRPDSIKSARNLFIWGAVGLVIAFVSKGLVGIITQMMA